MKTGGVLAFVLRESRGARGRLFFFTACVAIGVAAVVGVAGMSAAIDEGMRSQSRELLGADISLESRRALPANLGEVLDRLLPDAERTDVRELATMAGAVGAEGKVELSRLCELKVIGGGYPFYGELGLEPPLPLFELLDETSVIVAPELLAAMKLEVGDSIRVGGADFRIAATVHDEPDELDFALTLGPRVLLTFEGFDRTSLLGVGNRVKYKKLLKVGGNPSREVLEDIEGTIEGAFEEERQLQVKTHFGARGEVSRGIDQFESFLGLVALLSLILGGIGVAQVVRAWLASRVIGIAVWKSIGLRPGEILTLYLLQVLLFAVIGSAVGAALGGSVPFFLPFVVPELLVSAWQPLALLRGIGLGVGVAVLFALPALTAVWRVPPALVLRSGAEALPAPRLVRWSALVLLLFGVFASAYVQGGRFELAWKFTAALGVFALVLWLGARALVWLAGVMPRGRLGPYLAHGVSALARPGAGTVGAIVALGLGTLVVATSAFVGTRLESWVRQALGDDAPTVFLIDVQPDQWEGVEAVLADAGAARIDTVPVIMARVAKLDGRPVDEIIEEREADRTDDEREERMPSRWVLTREQRLTWLDELPASNSISERADAPDGDDEADDDELWVDPGRDEVSLEIAYAEGLGVGVGSTVTFDVLGVPFQFTVTSLRAIEWESFDINFFIVVEPGVLDDVPQMRLVAANVGADAEQGVQDRVVEAFPNVTMVRIRPILEKVATVLGHIAFGVRILSGFTILAGVAILAGAVGAAQLQRGREVALFKTLGVTRRGVLLVYAVEFGLLGLVAAGLGGLGAYALAWGFLTQALEIEAELPLLGLAVAIALTTLLAVVAGIAASGRALAVRPVRTLRG